jgi:hypothetical protein
MLSRLLTPPNAGIGTEAVYCFDTTQQLVCLSLLMPPTCAQDDLAEQMNAMEEDGQDGEEAADGASAKSNKRRRQEARRRKGKTQGQGQEGEEDEEEGSKRPELKPGKGGRGCCHPCRALTPQVHTSACGRG